MKYFVIPDSRDGCSIPTQPDAVKLAEVGKHIAAWKARYEVQGYYSNCRREHLALDEMTFHLVPENTEGGFFGIETGGAS